MEELMLFTGGKYACLAVMKMRWNLRFGTLIERIYMSITF
jgi:hypothetical protein